MALLLMVSDWYVEIYLSLIKSSHSLWLEASTKLDFYGVNPAQEAIL
jgi:hypothetical protein